MNLRCIFLEIHESYFQDQSEDEKNSHTIAIKDTKVSILGIKSMGLVGRTHCICVCAVFSIEESSGPQNPRVLIVLTDSKSAGAKGDVPMFYGFVHPLHPC